jgi:hypothetical protein
MTLTVAILVVLGLGEVAHAAPGAATSNRVIVESTTPAQVIVESTTPGASSAAASRRAAPPHGPSAVQGQPAVSVWSLWSWWWSVMGFGLSDQPSAAIGGGAAAPSSRR